MKILLIDNYDSFTYNLYHYISKFKKNVDVVRNDKIDSKTIFRKKYNKIVISPGPGNPNQSGHCLKIVKEVYKKIPILGVCLGHQIIGQVFGGKVVRAKNLMHGKTILKRKYNKVVISPGPGNPNQAGNCLKIVKEIHKKIPILGVCLGHQIIGQVFGGKIVRAKNLMHGKTSKIKHQNKGLLRNIKNNFDATRYHSLTIDRKTFPKDLIITAETKNKTIMGLMHKDFNIHGFQFHPESISTKIGIKLIKNFITN